MSEATGRSVSTLYLVGVYTAAFIVSAVVVSILSMLLDFRPFYISVIIVFPAALFMGNIWNTKEKAMPPSNRAWIVSFICSLVTVAIGFVSFKNSNLPQEAGTTYWLDAIIMLVVNGLIIRGGIWLATREASKMRARRGGGA